MGASAGGEVEEFLEEQEVDTHELENEINLVISKEIAEQNKLAKDKEPGRDRRVLTSSAACHYSSTVGKPRRSRQLRSARCFAGGKGQRSGLSS